VRDVSAAVPCRRFASAKGGIISKRRNFNLAIRQTRR
jgi:hypothetical protein